MRMREKERARVRARARVVARVVAKGKVTHHHARGRGSWRK